MGRRGESGRRGEDLDTRIKREDRTEEKRKEESRRGRQTALERVS